MKAKVLSIRYKLILIYLVSAIMAAISMFFMFFIFLLVNYKNYDEVANWMYKHFIGLFLISIVIFFILMSIFFLLLIKKEMNYLEEIINNIQIISKGNLDVNIPVKTKDEFGELASTINSMAYKLKTLIEQERNWEKSKSELINNVSHDLRTPLTSVLGYLQLIENHKYEDEAQLQRYIDIANTKCISLKKLIDELFEYSKLNSRELKISKTRIKLGELLEQVIVGFIPTLKESGMEYRISFSDTKIYTLADPILLARLFENLINNAINYGKEGKYIDIELLREESVAVVRIINYGEIIPEEDLPHIFDRLYRVEKSRSRQKGGSGLGLAIVKSIVDIHSGKITVDSKSNKTMFEVRLNID